MWFCMALNPLSEYWIEQVIAILLERLKVYTKNLEQLQGFLILILIRTFTADIWNGVWTLRAEKDKIVHSENIPLMDTVQSMSTTTLEQTYEYQK